MGKRVRSLVVTLAALGLLCATPALADFGDFGSPNPPDPADSPRVDTPNDPDFDRCESDDEDNPPGNPCGSYFEEQYQAFGFGPESSTAKYLDQSQLDEQGRKANKDAHGDTHEFDQISGVRARAACRSPAWPSRRWHCSGCSWPSADGCCAVGCGAAERALLEALEERRPERASRLSSPAPVPARRGVRLLHPQ
jgi:hypothetical protein